MDSDGKQVESEDASAKAEEELRLIRAHHFAGLVGDKTDAQIQKMLRGVGTEITVADLAAARHGAFLGFRLAGALAEALDIPIGVVCGIWPPEVAVLLQGMTVAIRDLQRRLPPA